MKKSKKPQPRQAKETKAVPKERRVRHYATLMAREVSGEIYSRGAGRPRPAKGLDALDAYFEIFRAHGGSDINHQAAGMFPTYHYPTSLLRHDARPAEWLELMRGKFYEALGACSSSLTKPEKKGSRRAYEAELHRRNETRIDARNALEFLDKIEEILRKPISPNRLPAVMIFAYEIGRLAERIIVRVFEYSTEVGREKRQLLRPTNEAMRLRDARRKENYAKAHQAVDAAGSNQSQAARDLGISRKTLRTWLSHGQ